MIARLARAEPLLIECVVRLLFFGQLFDPFRYAFERIFLCRFPQQTASAFCHISEP